MLFTLKVATNHESIIISSGALLNILRNCCNSGLITRARADLQGQFSHYQTLASGTSPRNLLPAWAGGHVSKIQNIWLCWTCYNISSVTAHIKWSRYDFWCVIKGRNVVFVVIEYQECHLGIHQWLKSSLDAYLT